MSPELVEVEEGDTLVGENASLEDIEKKISELGSKEEETPPEPTQEVEAAPDEEVPDTTEEPAQPQEETPPPAPPPTSEDDRITKADLIALLRERQQQQPPPAPKPEAPQLTNEQKLEALAKNPDAFIDSRIQPYKDQIRELEEQRAWDTARLYNPDFRRLEKTVEKLRQTHPNAVTGKTALETLEWYYLAAKGMEAQQRENDAIQAEENKKAKRLKEKKEASAVPKASAKVSTTTAKSPEQMSLKELEAEIKKLGG